MRSSVFIIHRLFLILLLTACAPQPTSSAPLDIDLIPYATSTLTPSQTPEGLVAAETPLPSPTPFTYTIRAGDTISSIALKFGVSMDSLQAANPEISPNTMSVGQVIKIPSDPANPSSEPTPTPATFTVQQVRCYSTADKGMWCFVLIHNDYSDFMENVSAQITLVDANNVAFGSQAALLPLNILPPNTSLPLAVFFLLRFRIARSHKSKSSLQFGYLQMMSVICRRRLAIRLSRSTQMDIRLASPAWCCCRTQPKLPSKFG